MSFIGGGAPRARGAAASRRTAKRARSDRQERPTALGREDTEAVLVCDEQLRVRYRSQASEEMLQLAGLQCSGDRLHGAAYSVRALSRAAASAVRTRRSAVLTLAPRPGEDHCVCIVVPLYEADPDKLQYVLLRLSTFPQPHLITRAAEAFGLTPAESQVAKLLLAGMNLREISSIRNTTMHTVRTQLKHLLQKTHTRRQAELVARLQRQSSRYS